MSSDASFGGARTDTGPRAAPPSLQESVEDTATGPASHRAELLRRRVEVQALREAVDRERRRRQQVVDRYEALLEDRSTGEDRSAESSLLGDLVEGLRRLTRPRRRA